MEDTNSDPWRKLRLSECWLAISMAVLLIGLIAALLIPSVPRIAFALPFGGAIGCFISYLSGSAFRCPRCGKQFFRYLWLTNIASGQCLHCGLQKWAPFERTSSAEGVKRDA